MIKLIIEDYLEDYSYWRSVTVPIEDKQLFIDGIHKLGLDWKLGHSDGNGGIGLKIYCEQDDLSNLADYVDSRKAKTESFGRKRLREQDTKIEVKHEGILEVPEGKKVDDLPMSHFEKLVKKNGLSKITKALNNLQVWNKNDDKKLSKWAGDMIDKLTKKYGKNESLKEDTYKSYWKYDVESDVFNRNEDSDTYLTKYDIRKVKLIPCKTPEECYDDERYWAVCSYEYPYDEFYGTKQEAYDMLLTSWNNSKYERIHDI